MYTVPKGGTTIISHPYNLNFYLLISVSIRYERFGDEMTGANGEQEAAVGGDGSSGDSQHRPIDPTQLNFHHNGLAAAPHGR